MTIRFAILLTLALTACREASSDGESPRVTHNVVSPPCSGCTVDLPPERTDPQPILVVLHGNHETATAAAARWRDAALAKGFVVLGLTCPRDRGCEDGKWYAWKETPSFVTGALATIARDMPLDPARTFLAGWSGGASAMGRHLDAWRPFSALIFHGGGQPPANGACPPRPVPAYFLVGDANPAHGAAMKLREKLASCAARVEWDLMSNGDHADEKRALDRSKAEQILEWADTHATGAIASR